MFCCGGFRPQTTVWEGVDAAQLQAAIATAQPAGDYMLLDLSTLPALP